MSICSVLVTVSNRPGMLLALATVFAEHRANITYVDLHAAGDYCRHVSRVHSRGRLGGHDSRRTPRRSRCVSVEETRVSSAGSMGSASSSWAVVHRSGRCALGAIAEADRHDVRGERISVDTIPLVGEAELAAAVRAIVRLPRVRLLVLAGALSGWRHHEGRRGSAAQRSLRDFAEHGWQRPGCR